MASHPSTNPIYGQRQASTSGTGQTNTPSSAPGSHTSSFIAQPGNGPPSTFIQALTQLRQTTSHGLGHSSGHGLIACTFPAPQLANPPFLGQPATAFPYPLLPRVHQAHMYALAAQHLGSHQPIQAQPSALRLVYIPQLIRKAVPAPAIVQHTLTSIAAVRAYRANRAISWHPLQNDDTIPRNEAECLLYVNTFLSSLTEVRECKDRERKPFPAHWKIPAKEGRFYYQGDDMANAAWDLLDIMMALHLFGPSALKTCRPEDIEEILKDEGMSFEERAGKICNVLRLSKHRCSMVIAGDSVEAFVALVSKKEREQESNSDNNGRRSSNLKDLKAELKAAKEALANVTANPSNSVTTAHAVAAAFASDASDSRSDAPTDGANAPIPAPPPTVAAAPGRPSSSTKSQSRSKTRQSASKGEIHNGQKSRGRQGVATDDSHKAQKPVSAKGVATFEGAVAGSNVRQGNHTFGDSQPSDDSNLAKQLNKHVGPTDTTPGTGRDFESEFAAWCTRQAELQRSATDSNIAHTFDYLNHSRAVDYDLTGLDGDDDLAYLVAYNATHPLPGDASSQGTVLRHDDVLYDGTVDASQKSNTVQDQGTFSNHRCEAMSSSQSPPSTVYNSSFGAEAADANSYAHYFQNVDDQTDFSKFLQDCFENQPASLSTATKRASQAAFDGGEDQYGEVSSNKRVRRNGHSTPEEPADGFVNSLLRGNTARRTSSGKGSRRS